MINGGYFGGATSVSLLIDGGSMKSPGATVETVDGTEYNLTRAALGRMADGSFEAAWTFWMNSAHYALSAPIDNDDTAGTTAPAPAPGSPGVTRWQPQDAIGGGPMLVWEGENVAAECAKKEVFSSLAGRNPRTAIGFSAQGQLVLLVCDGRGKQDSVGYTFTELADKMIELGCTHAINLDGGGSSTFVGREGRVLNLPSDTPGTTLQGATIVERSIPTAVVISLTE